MSFVEVMCGKFLSIEELRNTTLELMIAQLLSVQNTWARKAIVNFKLDAEKCICRR